MPSDRLSSCPYCGGDHPTYRSEWMGLPTLTCPEVPSPPGRRVGVAVTDRPERHGHAVVLADGEAIDVIHTHADGGTSHEHDGEDGPRLVGWADVLPGGGVDG